MPLWSTATAGGRIEVALIGAGIGESLSPALHEREGRLLGFDYRYHLQDLDLLGLEAGDVVTLVEQARANGLHGLNITYPCKQTVLPALDRLSPEAAALGAVNTIVFSAEGAVGHNTDWPGFQQSFASGLPDAAMTDVVIVGAPGAPGPRSPMPSCRWAPGTPTCSTWIARA